MLDAAAQDQLREAERLIEAGALQRAYALCQAVHIRFPQSAEPHLLVGDICLRRNAWPAALRALDKAAACEAPGPRAHATRGHALMKLRRLREGADEADRVLAFSSARLGDLMMAGGVLNAAGRLDRALAAYRAVEALDPSPAQMHIATVLHISGDLTGAETAYRSALGFHPREVLAWYSLSQVRAGALTEQDKAAIEALCAETTDVDDRVLLAHALAKMQEDDGEYEAALATLIALKHAKRRAAGYSFDANDRPLFDAAREASLQLRPREASDQFEPAPLFIVGLPRTGTTLAERILTSHPDVCSLGETDDLTAATRTVGGPATRGFTPTAISAAPSLDMQALAHTYFGLVEARGPSAPRTLDKMPLNFLYAGLIHAALPSARIICMRRGAMDSCIANYMQYFSGDAIYAYALDLADTARYYAGFDALAAHWRAALPADRFTELHYERLVADQRGETERLLAFCGLDWDERCLSFHENATPVATASTTQVRQPLYASSVGRWRRYGAGVQPALDVLAAHGIAPDAPPA